MRPDVFGLLSVAEAPGPCGLRQIRAATPIQAETGAGVRPVHGEYTCKAAAPTGLLSC